MGQQEALERYCPSSSLNHHAHRAHPTEVDLVTPVTRQAIGDFTHSLACTEFPRLFLSLFLPKTLLCPRLVVAVGLTLLNIMANQFFRYDFY